MGRTGGLKRSGKLNQFSTKRAATERSYRQAKQEKFSEDGPCDGCGRNLPCTSSHYIRRSEAPHLIDDPDNFGRHCDHCAEVCERGDYPALRDGRKIYDYIKRVHPQFLARMNERYRDRNGIYYEEAIWIG